MLNVLIHILNKILRNLFVDRQDALYSLSKTGKLESKIVKGFVAFLIFIFSIFPHPMYGKASASRLLAAFRIVYMSTCLRNFINIEFLIFSLLQVLRMLQIVD